MTDGPDNLVRQYLRRIDERTVKIADEVHDLKLRTTLVGEGLAGIHRRVDRVEARLDRIERRLDLVDAPN